MCARCWRSRSRPACCSVAIDIDEDLDVSRAAASAARRGMRDRPDAFHERSDAPATRTSCCRSARSPKPRARSSISRAVGRASRAPRSRWANVVRDGKYCAFSAICWTSRVSTTRAPKQCAMSCKRPRSAKSRAGQCVCRAPHAQRRTRPAVRRAMCRCTQIDAIVRRAPALQRTREAQQASSLARH